MSLYAIGDLHLSFGVPDKTMKIFNGWDNYQELIEKNWLETIKPEDTVVLAGDISWGMSLEQAYEDFRFINELPGQKIILKGNHDYWWTTIRKMENFFAESGFDTLHLLHNNHFAYEDIGICGTRGWVNVPGEKQEHDAKVLNREVQRLETSIKSALDAGLKPMVFMHYPPIFGSSFNYDILSVLYRYEISDCWYGHIHGRTGHGLCVQGVYDDIDFHLIAGDYIQFEPQKVR